MLLLDDAVEINKLITRCTIGAILVTWFKIKMITSIINKSIVESATFLCLNQS